MECGGSPPLLTNKTESPDLNRSNNRDVGDEVTYRPRSLNVFE
jgi:hypothetical protein